MLQTSLSSCHVLLPLSLLYITHCSSTVYSIFSRLPLHMALTDGLPFLYTTVYFVCVVLFVSPIDLYTGNMDPGRPMIFVAAGDNQVAMWDIETGACRYAFRALPPHVSDSEVYRCPKLDSVDIYVDRCAPTGLGQSSNARLRPRVDTGEGRRALGGSDSSSHRQPRSTMRAMACPLGVRAGRDSGLVHMGLITAGDDRQIRFWDLKSPRDSYTVTGLEPGESLPKYDSERASHLNPLPVDEFFYCQPAAAPGRSMGHGSSPAAERRGPIPPSPNHNDSILALGLLWNPRSMVVSASRDGAVKVWC
jgi:phosphoinositide-3-kinase regulatory subunit 4